MYMYASLKRLQVPFRKFKFPFLKDVFSYSVFLSFFFLGFALFKFNFCLLLLFLLLSLAIII